MAILLKSVMNSPTTAERIRSWSVIAVACVTLLVWTQPVRSQVTGDSPPAKPAPPPAKKVTPDDRAPTPVPSLADDEDEAPEPEPPLLAMTDRVRPRSPILRLASVPNMFGDLYNRSGQVQIGGSFGALADIPTAGVLGHSKISENNKAVTMDRVFFTMNHFHNALHADADIRDAIPASDLSVQRYTFGLEKRFLDQLWSVELRVPLVNRYDFGIPKFGVHGNEFGNLALVLKRQLVATCTTGVVAGLGIDAPTGENLIGNAGTTNFTLHNEAVQLSPYLGFMRAPNDRLFYHGFVQVGVPLSGNRVTYADDFFEQWGQFGSLTEQTLLHADVSVGRWIYRNRCAPVVTGIAPVVEFHYTTALQDADFVGGTIGPLGFQFGNQLNRIDLVQFTVGLHATLGARTTFRVGGAFPLNDDPDRPFDAEVLVSLNRYF